MGLFDFLPGVGDDEQPAPQYDPYDPDTWTGQDRADFLSNLGFDWQSGNGPAAVWLAPDGRRLTESNAFDLALGYSLGEGANKKEYGPDVPKPLTVKDQGLQRVELPDGSLGSYDPSTGTYYDGAGNPINPVGRPSGAGGGMTAYQGAQLGLDYARLAQDQSQFDAQQQQRAREFDANQQAEAAAREQASMQWLTQFNAQSQANARKAELDQKLLAFDEKKQAFAEGIANKNLAMEAARDAEVRRMNLVSTQMQQARLDLENRQFQETMAFQKQKAGQEFEESRQNRLASINESVGELARDTGDRGKYVATRLAHSGWGQQAPAGTDYRTAESLAPLEGQLRLRDEISAQANPFLASAMARPTNSVSFGDGAYSPEDVARINQQTRNQFIEQVGAAAQYGSQTFGVNPAEQARLNAQGIKTIADYAGEFGSGGDAVSGTKNADGTFTLDKVQKAASGGVLSSAMRMVGERGPELEIDLADGTTLILNASQQKGLKDNGLDLAKAKPYSGGGVAHYAGGGLFSGVGNVQDTDRTKANAFLTEAINRFRQGLTGTRFADPTKPLPSAVYASAPGFDVDAAQLFASGNALETGTPASSWLRQAMLYRPNAMSERIIGRSR